MIEPAYGPDRGPGPTRGGEAGAIALRTLGLDLLPWQRRVLTRGLERKAGRWRWRTVVVTVARQNGKLSLLRALIAHRLVRGQTVGALSHLRTWPAETMFEPGGGCLYRPAPAGAIRFPRHPG